MNVEDKRRLKLSDEEVKAELASEFPFLLDMNLEVERGNILLSVNGRDYQLGAYTESTSALLEEADFSTW